MAWTVTLTPGTPATFTRSYVKGIAIYRQFAVLSLPRPNTLRAEEATFYVDFEFKDHVWAWSSNHYRLLNMLVSVTGWNKTLNQPFNLSTRVRLSTPQNKRNWYIGFEYTLFYQPAKFHIWEGAPTTYWRQLYPE